MNLNFANYKTGKVRKLDDILIKTNDIDEW